MKNLPLLFISIFLFSLNIIAADQPCVEPLTGPLAELNAAPEVEVIPIPQFWENRGSGGLKAVRSPNGRNLLIHSWRDGVLLNEAGQPVVQFHGRHDGALRYLSFSRDGEYIYAYLHHQGPLYAWNAQSGEMIFDSWEYHRRMGVGALHEYGIIDAEGELYGVWFDWSIGPSHTEIRPITAGAALQNSLVENVREVRSIHQSSNKKTFALSVSARKGPIYFWNEAMPDRLTKIDLPSAIKSATINAISEDGKIMLTTNEAARRTRGPNATHPHFSLWDLESGTLKQTIRLKPEVFAGFAHLNSRQALSPDGKWVVWRTNHDAKQDIFLYSVEQAKIVAKLSWNYEFYDEPLSFSFSPDGKKVAANLLKAVAVWDVDHPEAPHFFTRLPDRNHFSFAEFDATSTDRPRLFTIEEGSGLLKIWSF